MGDERPGIPEGLHAEVLKKLGLGVFVCRLGDPSDDGSMRFVSVEPAEAGCPAFGGVPEPGQYIKDFLGPSAGPVVSRALAEVARTGEPLNAGSIPLGPEVQLCDLRAFRLGSGRGVCLIVEGDSRRCRSETALRQSQEKFAAAFMTSPDAQLIVRTEDALILDANLGFGRIFGWPPEEAIGRTAFDVGMWPSREVRDGLLALLRSSGTFDAVPSRLSRRDGTVFDALIFARIIEVEGQECVFATVRDVTEHLRAEKELRASEEKFSIAFQSSPLAMSIRSIEDGRVLETNGGFERMTGWDDEGGVPQEAWMDPAFPGGMRAQELASEDAHETEIRVRRKDGGIATLMASARRIEIAGEHCVLTATRDITGIREVEAALRMSEDRFEAAFRSSPDAIAINRLSDGTYLEVNDSFETISGWTRDELVGRSSLDPEIDIWVHPWQREGLVSGLRENGTVSNLEATFRMRDGHEVEGFMSASLVEVDGETCILSVTRDMTEHMKAQDDLRQSEARFSLAFHASPDAVLLNRLSDGLFLDANLGMQDLTGWSPDEVKGHYERDLGLWTDPEALGEFRERIATEGEIHGMEIVWRHRNGHPLMGSLSARRTVLDGELVVLAVVRDVSRQVADEVALQVANSRLEGTVQDAYALMGRIVEFRDPYTQGHQERVATVAVAIARELGLPEEDLGVLEYAALIHDIGKMRVPAEILSKPGVLDEAEWPLVKRHAEYGYQILKDAEFAKPIAEIVWCHHERMDGSGYPRGLAGEDIPLMARILAVADVVEAMASHRPYRPAMGLDAAVAEIGGHAALYDTEVVAACLRLQASGGLGI